MLMAAAALNLKKYLKKVAEKRLFSLIFNFTSPRVVVGVKSLEI